MYQGHCLTGTSCRHSWDESRGYRSLFNKGTCETIQVILSYLNISCSILTFWLPRRRIFHLLHLFRWPAPAMIVNPLYFSQHLFLLFTVQIFTPSLLGSTFLSSAPTRKSDFLLALILRTLIGSTSHLIFTSGVAAHWSRLLRQTVFYTPSTLTVNAGSKVIGQLSCSPNARNNRDLDIGITYRTEGDVHENRVQYKMFVLSYFPLYCNFRKKKNSLCLLFVLQEHTLISCQVLNSLVYPHFFKILPRTNYLKTQKLQTHSFYKLFHFEPWNVTVYNAYLIL